ncbi:hypothetical protein XENORESO_017121 [Xenotaenia resolanae]|uniref:Uncharacterized protein n=1 Tax=Xenotaenia resolanae TaxID=208358 RepID=A0ABV0X182_9TELE
MKQERKKRANPYDEDCYHYYCFYNLILMRASLDCPSVHSFTALCKASVAATRGRNKLNKTQVKHLQCLQPSRPLLVRDRVKKTQTDMGVLQCSGREGGAMWENQADHNKSCSSHSKKASSTFQR